MKLLTLWRAYEKAGERAAYYENLHQDCWLLMKDRTEEQRSWPRLASKYELMVEHIRKRLESQMAVIDEVVLVRGSDVQNR
jgi:hypothetical protein